MLDDKFGHYISRVRVREDIAPLYKNVFQVYQTKNPNGDMIKVNG